MIKEKEKKGGCETKENRESCELLKNIKRLNKKGKEKAVKETTEEGEKRKT